MNSCKRCPDASMRAIAKPLSAGWPRSKSVAFASSDGRCNASVRPKARASTHWAFMRPSGSPAVVALIQGQSLRRDGRPSIAKVRHDFSTHVGTRQPLPSNPSERAAAAPHPAGLLPPTCAKSSTTNTVPGASRCDKQAPPITQIYPVACPMHMDTCSTKLDGFEREPGSLGQRIRQEPGRRCLACAALVRRAHTILDPLKARTVRTLRVRLRRTDSG